MPAERVCMRRMREILRLKFAASLRIREIARLVGTWPLPEQVSDSDLEAALYTNIGSKQGHRRHVEPDWALIHRELKRKHVTLSILWDEYIEQHPEARRDQKPLDQGPRDRSRWQLTSVDAWRVNYVQRLRYFAQVEAEAKKATKASDNML
jgi:hypothetical protein